MEYFEVYAVSHGRCVIPPIAEFSSERAAIEYAFMHRISPYLIFRWGDKINGHLAGDNDGNKAGYYQGKNSHEPAIAALQKIIERENERIAKS